MGNKSLKGREDFVREGRGIDWPEIQHLFEFEPDRASFRNGVPVADSELNHSSEFLPLAIGESPGNLLGVVGFVEH